MCNNCQITNAKDYRHSFEIPMVTIAILLSISAVIASVGTTLTNSTDEIEIKNEWLLVGYIILASPLIIFFNRLYISARQRANAPRVGPDQFPEIWEIYQELIHKIDLRKIPSLYILNGNGVVNAFAMSCTARWSYIFLHAEIAALAKQDPNIVRFVLAHELAHHKLGHVKLWRLAIGVVMNMLVLPGKALIRAQEYSADRLALAVCPDAHDAILLLAVGPWMVKQINPEAYYYQLQDEEHRAMISVANIASDHAVMSKRYKALRDIKEKGFGVHGDMF